MPFTLTALALCLPLAAAECPSSAAACPAGEVQDRANLGASSLMQRPEGVDLLSGDDARHAKHDKHDKHEHMCMPLDNHGTYFSVPLLFGSEKQQVDVVVDTGSNALVVTDCFCNGCHVEEGMCVDMDPSSTLNLHCLRNGTKKVQPQTATIMYGSGVIAGYIVEDMVRMGNVKHLAKMLLVQVSYLNIAAPFQGILGLGLPLNKTGLAEMKKEAQEEAEAAAAEAAAAAAAGSEDDLAQIQRHQKHVRNEAGRGSPSLRAHGQQGQRRAGRSPHVSTLQHTASKAQNGGLPNITWERDGLTCGTTTVLNESDLEHSAEGAGFVDGLLEQVDAERFSMCFNDGDTPGILRVNQPKASAEQTLENIGFFHWGLGLHGISVAGVALPDICTNMTEGMISPCGLIPDSGTTLITAPQAHIDGLKAGICDQWPPCASLTKGEADTAVKADTFDVLLQSCGEFMGDTDSIDDILPSLDFVASGPDGSRTLNLTLPPWAYILEGRYEDPTTGENGTRCEAMFGFMEYETANNGPIWILGTSLFYQYTVGFEYDSAHPAISFTPRTESPCGTCGMSLTLTRAEQEVQQKQRRRLRQKRGEPLYPRIDTTQPL